MSSDNSVSEVRSVQKDPEGEHRLMTFKATQLIWLFLGILEILIGLRILLRLMGANPDSIFVSLLYGFTNLFLFPFEGLIGSPAGNGMVLEISSFVAMIFYALVAWAIERLVWVIFYRPRRPLERVTRTTINEDHTKL